MKKPPHAKTGTALGILRFVFRSLGRILPDVFARFAFNLWITTHRIDRPGYEEHYAGKAERFTVHATGLDVVVWKWGEGKPVLFIHGWSGRGTQAANFIEPLNAAGFQVISFDAPAHGETKGRQTSIFQITDVLMAVDEQLGPFHSVITHSFGGMVLAYAMKEGFLTRSAVCICPPLGLDTIVEHFRNMLTLPDTVYAQLKQRLYTIYGTSLADKVSTLKNFEDRSMPALIIHDTDDDVVPFDDGVKLAETWTGAELMRTEGLGHRRILRDDKVIREVVQFITEN